MSQLTTLIWLKWTLFRNSLRSSKAVVNRIASVVAMLAALAFALIIGVGVGAAAYALTAPEMGLQSLSENMHSQGSPIPSAEFVFFSIFTMCFLLWATLPLSMGASRQFDPGNLLLYPISLRKLFAVDFLSEVVSLQSLFTIPAILAIGIGAGVAQGKVASGILLALVAAAFGIALSKWVSTSVGSLLRKKRSRGETLLALIGVLAGLGGALFGQIAPMLFRHADSVSTLRWTPPGAMAFALTHGLVDGGRAAYLLGLALASIYTVLLVALAYWLARRSIAGGGKKRARPKSSVTHLQQNYAGWNIPLLSSGVAAIFEKELRYLMRNAQLRMMTLMPLILIVIRLMNRRRFSPRGIEGNAYAANFFQYADGLMPTAGVLYVFLILSGLFCNQFAFEHSGMRTLLLSPVDRKSILLGKNLAISTVALIFSASLLLINQLVFQDLTPGALLFATLSFLTFVPLMSVTGNWFSVRFPKRMKFGKRLNVSGVVGLLLIPMIIGLALVPLAAAAAGYLSQSLLIEYVTLAILAVLATGFYLLTISAQGETLQQRELEILEAVTDPGNG